MDFWKRKRKCWVALYANVWKTKKMALVYAHQSRFVYSLRQGRIAPAFAVASIYFCCNMPVTTVIIKEIFS